MISGMFAAIAGLCLLAIPARLSPMSASSYMLPSIIAVVFGGTSLAGGKGRLHRHHGRRVLLVILQSILTTINIEGPDARWCSARRCSCS